MESRLARITWKLALPTSILFAIAMMPLAARANTVTFDVSASMYVQPNQGATNTCVSAGCTLGGTITLDTSAGAPNNGFVSADITMSGESPAAGPFTSFSNFYDGGTFATFSIGDGANATLVLVIPSNTGSVVGYTGGSLDSFTAVDDLYGVWGLISGSLTEESPAAEPSSVALLGLVLAAFGIVSLVYRRKGFVASGL